MSDFIKAEPTYNLKHPGFLPRVPKAGRQLSDTRLWNLKGQVHLSSQLLQEDKKVTFHLNASMSFIVTQNEEVNLWFLLDRCLNKDHLRAHCHGTLAICRSQLSAPTRTGVPEPWTRQAIGLGHKREWKIAALRDI